MALPAILVLIHTAMCVLVLPVPAPVTVFPLLALSAKRFCACIIRKDPERWYVGVGDDCRANVHRHIVVILLRLWRLG